MPPAGTFTVPSGIQSVTADCMLQDSVKMPSAVEESAVVASRFRVGEYISAVIWLFAGEKVSARRKPLPPLSPS